MFLFITMSPNLLGKIFSMSREYKVRKSRLILEALKFAFYGSEFRELVEERTAHRRKKEGNDTK